jgi:hypothetical protein
MIMVKSFTRVGSKRLLNVSKKKNFHLITILSACSSSVERVADQDRRQLRLICLAGFQKFAQSKVLQNSTKNSASPTLLKVFNNQVTDNSSNS